MPLFLLLLALLVLGESSKQVLTFLDLSVGVSVHDLGKIFHQPEVGPHGISKTCQLAQFRDQSHLITSLPVLIDKERLIWVRDGFVVPGLIVVLIAHLGTLLVEGSRWGHSKVNSFNSVSFLIVPIKKS